ncbi:MAG: hypothetical protein ABIX01_09975 [Chitinophagaceae bacterium]
MTKLKNILGNILPILIPVLLIGLWILGAVHGKKKHNVDPFSANFFVCWYYGLETFWHKLDYKELNDDIKVAAYLIMQKPTGIDAKEQLDFNETKKGLKEVLEKLDSKETDYVKSGVNTFVEFMSSIQDDIINALLNYKTAKIFDISVSDKTKSLSKKCASFGLEKEMKEMETELEKIKNTFNEKLEGNSQHFDESLIDEKKLKDEAVQKTSVINLTVREIFGE